MFLRLIAAAALGIVFLSAGPPTNIVDEVTAAVRARDYADALQLAGQGIKAAPRDARLWTLQGIAFSRSGRKDEALSSFYQALKIRPGYLAALEGAAEVEYASGSSRAVTLLKEILAQQPYDPVSHAMLAALLFKKGDCAGALPHFEQGGTVVRSQPLALEQYGTCLVRIKRTEEAIPIFERLVGAQPENARVRYNLAMLQFLVKRNTDAVATLRPLIESDRPSADALALASSLYEKSGDTPRAVEMLRKAIVLAPDRTEYYLDFATLCFNHKSFQVGADLITAGLTQNPDAASLYVARGVLYVQLGQYDKAQSDFERASRLDPVQTFSSQAQSLAQLQENDLDRALATTESQLRTKGDDPFLNYLLAEILSRQGARPGSPEFQRAVEAASRAVTIKSDFIVARNLLSGLYMKSGQLDEAIEQCRRVLNTDPSDQTALYRLMLALQKTGKREEVPSLLKRLAQAREDAQKREVEEARYRLVEQPPALAPAAAK